MGSGRGVASSAGAKAKGAARPPPPAAAAATSCIYLDWNATTPVYPEVAREMTALMGCWGNPSSSHALGRPAKEAVDLGRERVAKLINATPGEIRFTSCGTESDNWAIYAGVKRARLAGVAMPHVVTSNIEHPAVIEALKAFREDGLLEYTEVAVDSEGLLPLDAVAAAFRDETVLVSVMHSNNEIGALQPIAAIAELAHERGACMHTDAAQSLGKVDVDVKALGVDLLTVVRHKFGAPKGVAALYVSEALGDDFPSFLHGGGQEGGLRAGTENVLMIAGLGKAAEIAHEERAAIQDNMRARTAQLEALLRAGLPGAEVRTNGPWDAARRLPNTLSLSIDGLRASAVLAELSEEVAASAGAACHTGAASISSVLAAIGLEERFAFGTLRLSVGRSTTEADVAEAAKRILAKVRL